MYVQRCGPVKGFVQPQPGLDLCCTCRSKYPTTTRHTDNLSLFW